MEVVQTFWQVPCIGQYLSLFRGVFKFPEMDIEELEESLLCPGSDLLQAIIISLLQSCCRRKCIGLDNWEEYLCQFLERKWAKLESRKNPIANGEEFFSLNLVTKIEILYSLCLYRLDCSDVEVIMKAMDADALRVQSLGSDSLGNVYWYFYGTRLYKEEPRIKRKNWEDEWKEQKDSQILKRKRGRPKKQESDANSETSNKKKGNILSLNSQSRWSVVCSTLLDWETFAEKFKNSKVKSEMALYALVTKNFLPALSDLYDEKEKRRRQKLMEFVPQKPATRLDSKKAHKKQASSSEMSENEDDVKVRKTRNSTDRASMLEARIKRTEEKDVSSSEEVSWNELKQVTETPLDCELADVDISSDVNVFAKLHRVMAKVRLHKHAWPFLNPVDEAIAPGYYNIIRDPIDLSAMERKMELKTYQTLIQVDLDMQKMVLNSRLYNGADSEYTDMAKMLLNVFRENLSSEMISTRGLQKMKKVDVDYTLMKQRARGMKGRFPPRVEKQRMKMKLKRGKKRRVPNMQGLEMLAQASEQALKDVHMTEAELFIPENHKRPSKSYPNLKIMPIQSHPQYLIEKLSSSSCSSDSDSNHREESQTDSEGKKNGRSMCPQPNGITCSAVRRDSVSPESNNNSTFLSPGSDSSSNERFSEIPDLSKSELDDACNMLGIQNEATKSDALTSLSSLLCRIIKDNSEFDITNAQGYEESTGSSLSRPSPNNASEEGKSDSDSQPQYATHPLNQNKLPPQIGPKRDIVGFQPLSEITTVDASILGISTDNSCTVGEDSIECSSESSPKYRANINSEGLLQDNQDDGPPCLNPSAYEYLNPSPSYSTANNRSPLSDPELLSAIISKAKTMSPDSQFHDVPQVSSNGFEPLSSLPSRISPTFCFIPSPQGINNYTPCPVSIANGSYIPSEEMRVSPNNKDVPKTMLPNPMPLQVPNGVMPLFLSQASSFPMSTASGQFTFVPSLSQQVPRPIAMLSSCLPSVVSPPSISHVTSTSESSPKRKVNVISHIHDHMTKTNSPKTKKKRAIAPKQVQPAIQVSSDTTTTNPIIIRPSIFQRSPECTSGFSSPPDKVSSSINDPLPGLNIDPNNHFWNPKDPHPLHSIPVTHSIPLHPMFATQSHDSPLITSNSYAGPRLPPMSAITGRTFEPFNPLGQLNAFPVNASERDLASKNVTSMPNGLYPIMYSMPNAANLQNSIICHKNLQLNKPVEVPVSSPTYLMQGMPQRPVQNVNNMSPQQVRHPGYLNMPSFVMPHQPTMHPILPSPILPNVVEVDSQISSSPTGNKTVPVYTVLQNVPARSR